MANTFMIRLRPMTHDDFPLILSWLAKPHVKEWWDDGDDTIEKVTNHYGDQSLTNERFILLYHDNVQSESEQPIGYLQYEIGEMGIASIDQFIGEEALIDRGIGTAAIRLMLAYLRQHHRISVVTVDPSPANRRAIRCYEKVGFHHDETLSSPTGGEAYMMSIAY